MKTFKKVLKTLPAFILLFSGSFSAHAQVANSKKGLADEQELSVKDEPSISEGSEERSDVRFVKFEAETEQHEIHLKWLVNSEGNLTAFILQRSEDGKSFTDLQNIDITICGSGAYDATDREPKFGIAYYRLRMYDSDGKISYSEVIPAKYSNSKSILTIHPNPVADEVEIVSVTHQSMTSVLKIMDSFGHVMVQYPWDEHDGLNRLQINVSNLAKGVYFVTLENGSEISKIRLIKE